MFRRKRSGSKNILRPATKKGQQRQIRVVNSPIRKANKPLSTKELLKIGSEVKSICIIRSLGGIGDVLMITPGIRALKKKYPKLNITVAIDRRRVWDDSYYHLLSNAPISTS